MMMRINYLFISPPLNEQRRIVAKIEALKARSQRVKKALEEYPQLLERIRAERAKLQSKTAKKSTTKTSARSTKKTQPQQEE